MPDKSPRKPSAKKAPDRSLKEKRLDKKDKKSLHSFRSCGNAALEPHSEQTISNRVASPKRSPPPRV